MDDFVILTDSCCDMTARMAADLELEVLPLSLNMEDRVYHNYLDGREIGFQDFYARLRAGALATTSAISVGVFDEAMRKILDSGRDVLYLAFSSALSTTYQSAVIAADDLREAYPGRKIFVVDTLSASLGQGLLVYLCVQEKRKGKTIDQVHVFAEETKAKVCHWFTVDDLNHLKRGGRVSAAAALFGTMLSIKPVLHVDDDGPSGARQQDPGAEGVPAGPGGPHGGERRRPGGADHLHQPRGLRGRTLSLWQTRCAAASAYRTSISTTWGRSSATTPALARWPCFSWAAAGEARRKSVPSEGRFSLEIKYNSAPAER